MNLTDQAILELQARKLDRLLNLERQKQLQFNELILLFKKLGIQMELMAKILEIKND